VAVSTAVFIQRSIFVTCQSQGPSLILRCSHTGNSTLIPPSGFKASSPTPYLFASFMALCTLSGTCYLSNDVTHHFVTESRDIYPSIVRDAGMLPSEHSGSCRHLD